MRSVVKRSKIFVARLVVFGLILTLALAVVIFLMFNQKPNTIENTVAINQPTTPKPIEVSSDILFFGNTYWGRYINDWSMASSLKYKYPFSRLDEFNRANYNAWITGLECPTVAGVNMTSYEEDSTLTFNCSPNYLPEAAKWFTAFTLANNHTDNQGANGFSETQEHLNDNGIQYFGHYDPRELSDICEVISLPVTILNDNNENQSGSIPVAMCGYHAVFRLPEQDAVNVMKSYSKYMPVFALPHMGVEYKSSPDSLKTNFFRSLIDGGADVVLGDHPHWIQTSESYKGHLIVYSMGNFIFDQQDTPEVVRSAAIRVFIKSSDHDSSDLIKWLALGEECKTYHDDCLKQIKTQNLKKINFSYGFDVVGTNDSDKIVKPATKAQQQDILKRLDWSNTMDGLQVPYGRL